MEYLVSFDGTIRIIAYDEENARETAYARLDTLLHAWSNTTGEGQISWELTDNTIRVKQTDAGS